MSSDCGIGTPAGYTGPCNGRYQAKDAGAGSIGALQSAPVVAALVGAGVLLAALLFAAFATRAVGSFFKERKRRERERLRDAGTPLFSERVAQHLKEHPELARDGDANDLDAPDDVELDAEDDTEAGEDEADWTSDSPGYARKFE